MNRQIRFHLIALVALALVSLVIVLAAIGCGAGSAGAAFPTPQRCTATPARRTITPAPIRPDLIQARSVPGSEVARFVLNTP